MQLKQLAIIILALILISPFALGFYDRISYVGIDIVNESNGKLYNSTYDVTSYIFYLASCEGTPDYTETMGSVNITNGKFTVSVNYTSTNQTFYIKPSIEDDNQTCFEYTAAGQTKLADNSNMLGGNLASAFYLATNPDLYWNNKANWSSAITYADIVAEFSDCDGNEYLGADGDCHSDSSGWNECSDVSACGYYSVEGNLTDVLDDNYYPLSNIYYYINLSNVSAAYYPLNNPFGFINASNVSSGGNSSEEIQAVIDTAYPDLDTDDTDDFDGSYSSLADVPANIDEDSTDDYTIDNPFLFINGSNVSAYETDAAHDECSEISGCVESAITDGNTGWENEYGFTNETWVGANYYPLDNPFGYINQSNVSISDTNTLYVGDNIYIYNATNTMTFNETKNNATIIAITDARDSDTTYSALSEFVDDVGFYYTEANLTALLDDNYADISVVDTDTHELWTLNTTVLQNESGKLGIVKSWFDNLYLDNTDDQTCAEVSGCVENAFYQESDLTTLLDDNYADIGVTDTVLSMNSTQFANNSGTTTLNEGSITITESQISDLQSYLTAEIDDSVTNELDNTNISVVSAQVTGTTTKTLSIEQKDNSGNVLTNITTDFTDISGSGGNSTEEILATFSDDNTTIWSGINGKYALTNPFGFINDSNVSAKYYLLSNPFGFINLSNVTSGGNSTEEIKAAIDSEYPNLDTDSTDDFTWDYDYGDLINTPTKFGNSTFEIQTAVNISAVYGFSSSDLVCTNCIDGTEIAELSDADVSNTLTCSVLTDDDTYALTASDETFDGYITIAKNLTVEGIVLEADTTNHKIYDNTTCIIIKGDTSTLEIC